MQLPLTASFVAETTAEQAALARAADTWPFSACAAGDRHACHRAAAEMATLRKYSVVLNYSSVRLGLLLLGNLACQINLVIGREKFIVNTLISNMIAH